MGICAVLRFRASGDSCWYRRGVFAKMSYSIAVHNLWGAFWNWVYNTPSHEIFGVLLTPVLVFCWTVGAIVKGVWLGICEYRWCAQRRRLRRN